MIATDIVLENLTLPVLNTCSFPTVNLPINYSHKNGKHYHNQDLNQSEHCHVRVLAKHKPESFPALFNAVYDSVSLWWVGAAYVMNFLLGVVGGSEIGR